MDLAIRSEEAGDFYVPAYKVKVGGADLREEHALAISRVEVDLSLEQAGKFSFTIVNSYSNQNLEFRTGRGRPLLPLFPFGAEVEMFIGYGSKPPLLMTGTLTNVATSFPQDGAPELTISGQDHFFPLTLGRPTRSYRENRDSDVVRRIASRYNLAVRGATTEVSQAQIEQNQESDLAFIAKLAERNHFEFYMVDRTLVFDQPQDDRSGVITLNWGTSLLSFRPEANLSGQFSRIEIVGWDAARKRPIVGVATAGSERGREPRRRSGSQQVSTVTKEPATLRLRQPVFTQAEADTRARAVLDQVGKEFLTGDGESIGFSELRAGRNVELTGLGAQFSKNYYLRQTTHRSDTNSYRTTFKVKEAWL